jgi:hypothetical protein
MAPMSISARAEQWRRDAEVLRRYGQDSIAAVLEALAGELESDTVQVSPEVGLADAVRLSGYCAAHLRRLVKEEKLRNLGTAKNPKFSTADLPRKPGYSPDNKRLALGSPQPQISRHRQVARAVVQRRTNDGAD